jgi:hypothetical protein
MEIRYIASLSVTYLPSMSFFGRHIIICYKLRSSLKIIQTLVLFNPMNVPWKDFRHEPFGL